MEWYKFAESPEDRSLHLNTLQKIFEMGDMEIKYNALINTDISGFFSL